MPVKEKTDRKTIARVQLEMSPERIKELEKLMVELGIRTKKDLIEDAVTFFETMVGERKLGQLVGSMNEHTREFNRVLMASIERAAPRKLTIQKL